MAKRLSTPIRAITFDLDDTLWDVWAVIERAEQRLHQWLSERHPAITARFQPADIRALRERVLVEQPQLAHDLGEVRKACLRLAAAEVGVADLCADSAYAVFFAARNEVEFFEDVLPTLETLKERYVLAALSNGNADVKLVGLGHLFDVAINPSHAGAAKPDPAIFALACERLQLEPHEIVHVGDNPEHDVLGAGRAGFHTVWVNRDLRPWPGGRVPDAVIRSLAELDKVLLGWQPQRRHA